MNKPHLPLHLFLIPFLYVIFLQTYKFFLLLLQKFCMCQHMCTMSYLNKQWKVIIMKIHIHLCVAHIILYVSCVPGDLDDFTIPECLMDSSYLLLCHITFPIFLLFFFFIAWATLNFHSKFVLLDGNSKLIIFIAVRNNSSRTNNVEFLCCFVISFYTLIKSLSSSFLCACTADATFQLLMLT